MPLSADPPGGGCWQVPTIVRSLGSGSYGLAYRCRDIRTGEHVVVKQSEPSKGRRPIGRRSLPCPTASNI
ncbi:hypothetical protein [Paenibacillus tyrfis]|uniref:hypothetical protein n=1 Tax=Paenibacillus tyrfis TaxID=1501230 RepID=UPI000B0C229A|nr:hypothetical protein [Paenibacillus tyrfis]